MAAPKLLLLTHDTKEVTALSQYLHGLAWITLWARTVKDALKSFENEQLDAVIIGPEAAGENLSDTVAKFREAWPDVKLVLFVDGETPLALMNSKGGCDRVLVRPFNEDDQLDIVIAEITPYDNEKAGWARVLIAEDSLTARRAIDRSVRKIGLRPAFVETMEQAIKAMKKYEFDCVVTDIFMPGMGGIGGIMKIRKEDYKTPIVAISGGCGPDMTAGEALRAASHIGADRCMVKPFNASQFSEAVKGAIAERAEKAAKIEAERAEIERIKAEQGDVAPPAASAA